MQSVGINNRNRPDIPRKLAINHPEKISSRVSPYFFPFFGGKKGKYKCDNTHIYNNRSSRLRRVGMKNRIPSIGIVCLLVIGGFFGLITFESDVVRAGVTWYVGSGPGNHTASVQLITFIYGKGSV